MTEGPKSSFNFEEWANAKIERPSTIIPGIDPRTVYNTPKKVEEVLQATDKTE